ncbi:MAG: fumarylacetoacetase, partial [Candidatus Kariarchaeaceae archaeon]|jgi:fumarylacetoacetase
MIRGPENALMANWKHLPVAYHGRASSVILSGIDIHRPFGQTKSPESETPDFGPSKRLDYELEMGFVVGKGNDLGHPISVDDAANHIFGVVIVNDWSARDIQVWEYRPLGPFLAKNFATSISPFVVTLDALEPFRVLGPKQDPKPLPYLQTKEPWSYNVHLEVALQTKNMEFEQTISKSNMKFLYWNMNQQMAHHTINGCNMRTGDLFGTGTISGADQENRGCLMELTELGKKPLQFTNGDTRTFLEDGDKVTLTGWCQGEGYRIGFGEVSTKILSAKSIN